MLSDEEEQVLVQFLETYRRPLEWDAELGDKEKVKRTIQTRLYQRINKTKKNNYKIYAIAASLALLVGLLIFVKNYNGRTGATMIMAHTESQIDSLMLEDGSTVFLNKHTSFEYPAHFNGATRAVRLVKGSAFFKVAKDSSKPFIITSGDLKTKVLGTSFSITNIDSVLNVTVSTGKVNVSTEKENHDLLPDEQVYFDKSDMRLLKRRVNPDVYSGWRYYDVNYDNISLEELSTVVELRYGLPFHFDQPHLKQQKVKVSFLKGDTLESVIRKLNFITNVKLKIKENVINVTTDEPKIKKSSGLWQQTRTKSALNES